MYSSIVVEALKVMGSGTNEVIECYKFRPWGLCRNEYQRQKYKNFLGTRVWLVYEGDSLTPICEPIVSTMWDPEHLTALQPSAACYGDSLTFLLCFALNNTNETGGSRMTLCFVKWCQCFRELATKHLLSMKNGVFWVVTPCGSCNNPEDTILHSHRHENLKSYIYCLCL
jgi:hypothetical protein